MKTSGIKKHVPNMMSSFRIIGAIALPFLAWKSWEIEITLPFIDKTFPNVPIVWMITFLVLIFTDMFDGKLARKFKAESELGAILDAIGDVLTIAIGGTICFVLFVRDSLETWRFWLYVGIMVLCVLNEVLVYMLAKIYHGKGNTVHTYYQKSFAVYCYASVFFWAFLRTIPVWSISLLLAISIFATIDESIYVIRTAEYDVDFKGHGFEKYKKRENASNGDLT